MKKLIFILVALMALVSCQKPSYTLKVDLSVLFPKDSINPEQLLLSENGPAISVDSAWLVSDGTQMGEKVAVTDGIATLCGTVDEPVLGKLILCIKFPIKDEKTGMELPRRLLYEIGLIVEPGDIFIENSDRLFAARGTRLNDALPAAIETFLAHLQESSDSAKQIISDYIAIHKDDVSVVKLLQVTSGLLSDKEKLEYINLCTSKIQSNSVMSQIKEDAELALQSPQEGDMFKDFEAEYEGQVSRLSDYVGKGQYVLVDFWASWCQPCRMEIPNLKAAYDKYGDKGLVVLGVAAWDQPENTLKAIDEDGIEYPQILNTQAEGTKVYGIKGIPHIILFGPDGTLLKRGLRGEGIEQALSEILK